MKRTPWIERKFTFDLPEGWIYNELERLEGAIPRMHFLLDQLSEEESAQRLHGKWSAKEQIGHLYDLEALHISRLKEIKIKQEVLSPADMQNLVTEASDHNRSSKAHLTKAFSNRRGELLELFQSLSDEDHYFGSFHERLGVKMRPVDIASFTASHDDHHLSYVSDIVKNFRR